MTPSATLPLLQVQDLCFAFPQRPLFDHWSASFGPGVSLVLGDDGSGKSTLMRLLAGALIAQGGRLIVQGLDLATQGARYRQQVAWCDPAATEWEALCVTEVLTALRQRWPTLQDERLREHIHGLSLDTHLHKPLAQLSTGSRRKVWLAAALAAGTPVTLIDQPFAALDLPSVRHVQAALCDLAREPARACIVAHDEDLGPVPLAQACRLG
jgi:ABC-type cobalamin/Fe3+-siderophores transport system ATPase subunit